MKCPNCNHEEPIFREDGKMVACMDHKTEGQDMAIEREYVEWYCRAIYDASTRYYQTHLRGWDRNPDLVYPEYGRRFTRIVVEGSQRYVHAFVDMTNGDVIKAAGWKAPQKDKNGFAVRFNLVDDESRERGFRAIDPHGAYLYKGAIDKAARATV